MKILLTFILCLLTPLCYGATLTAGYTPVVAQGGNAPQLQNASIYDTGSTNGFGEVGIATTSPGSTLSVNGGMSVGAYSTQSSPSGGLIVSGNTGIAEASPVEVLDVGGIIKTRGMVEVGLPSVGGKTYACFDGNGNLISQTSAC